LGETYLHYAGYNLIPTTDAYAKSRTAAKRAISIDEFNPRAHKVMSYIHFFYDWDWKSTSLEYSKAVEYGLSESNEFIIYYYIFLNKDYDRAINISKKILETDALHIESHWQLGICYYFAERFEEALSSINNALELDPNYSDGHHWKGVVLGHLGRFDEAISSLEKALEITKGEGLANLDLIAVKIQMGKKDEALKLMESREYLDPMDAAKLYTLIGMPDEAFYWIEKGFQARSVMMVSLKHSWFWDPLRDDPRFTEIYSKMNF